MHKSLEFNTSGKEVGANIKLPRCRAGGSSQVWQQGVGQLQLARNLRAQELHTVCSYGHGFGLLLITIPFGPSRQHGSHFPLNFSGGMASQDLYPSFLRGLPLKAKGHPEVFSERDAAGYMGCDERRRGIWACVSPGGSRGLPPRLQGLRPCGRHPPERFEAGPGKIWGWGCLVEDSHRLAQRATKRNAKFVRVARLGDPSYRRQIALQETDTAPFGPRFH